MGTYVHLKTYLTYTHCVHCINKFEIVMAKPVLVVNTKFSKKSGGLRGDLICFKLVWTNTVISNAGQAHVDFSENVLIFKFRLISYIEVNEYRRYNTEIGQICH